MSQCIAKQILPTALQDDIWAIYKNENLGFSIDYPRKAVNPYGGYNWVEKDDFASYRLKPDLVPISVFEDTDSAYFSYAYSYELGDQVSEGNHTNFKSCTKVDNTLTELRKERRTWQIIAKKVVNEAALVTFLQQRFGSGCTIDEKVPTEQEGVLEVRVRGDGKDL